jgi:hypothetical protein
VFENSVKRKILGSKWEGARGGWTKFLGPSGREQEEVGQNAWVQVGGSKRRLDKMLGSRWEGARGGWTKLRDRNLFSSSNIIGVIKSNRKKWAKHVAHAVFVTKI